MDGNGPVLGSNLALDEKSQTAPRSDRCLHPKDQPNLGEQTFLAGSGSQIGVNSAQEEMKAWMAVRSEHCLHHNAQQIHGAMKSGAGSGLVLPGVNWARKAIALPAVRCCDRCLS